jgi:nitrogen fixation protein FixH
MTGTIRGAHVFWAVGVFFAAMIAVEAYFVVRAVATFPGEETRNSYILGLDYNATLEKRESQRRLGWRVQAGIEGKATLVVRIGDADGRELSGLDVVAKAHQAGQSADAETLRLDERSPGEYAAPVNMTGRIRFSIEARRQGGAETAFEAAKTLVIP